MGAGCSFLLFCDLLSPLSAELSLFFSYFLGVSGVAQKPPFSEHHFLEDLSYGLHFLKLLLNNLKNKNGRPEADRSRVARRTETSRRASGLGRVLEPFLQRPRGLIPSYVQRWKAGINGKRSDSKRGGLARLGKWTGIFSRHRKHGGESRKAFRSGQFTKEKLRTLETPDFRQQCPGSHPLAR